MTTEETTAIPQAGLRLPIIDSLRGIAALAVCLLHFTCSSGVLEENDPIRIVGQYGGLGVQVFFVVSGFT